MRSRDGMAPSWHPARPNEQDCRYTVTDAVGLGRVRDLTERVD
jgi:hypothetical protein